MKGKCKYLKNGECAITGCYCNSYEICDYYEEEED
jgi:hypothetical protein